MRVVQHEIACLLCERDVPFDVLRVQDRRAAKLRKHAGRRFQRAIVGQVLEQERPRHELSAISRTRHRSELADFFVLVLALERVYLKTLPRETDAKSVQRMRQSYHFRMEKPCSRCNCRTHLVTANVLAEDRPEWAINVSMLLAFLRQKEGRKAVRHPLTVAVLDQHLRKRVPVLQRPDLLLLDPLLGRQELLARRI